MQRRDFITGLGLGSVALGATVGAIGTACAKTEYQWNLVTTWPTNFPGLGTGANRLAALIGEMSGGRIQIQVHGAGERVPTYGVFDAVARGEAEMGHGSAYYWKDNIQAARFFSSVPFGLSAQEMNAWLYFGGGLELWTELYAPFGVIPAPAGNSGVQMGGWFNKEINAVADLKGLRMRIPGLGGEILARAGGIPVNLSGSDLFAALQENKIDATEWVGPYNDLSFGLYKVAKYYYYPGWHEPGTVMEAIINKRVHDALPPDLQSIISNACKVVNQEMLAEYTARNPLALQTLITKHDVALRRFPDAVLAVLRRFSDEILTELAQKDDACARVYASYRKFQVQSNAWSTISDLTDQLAHGST